MSDILEPLQRIEGYVLRDQLGFKLSRAARVAQRRLEADLAQEGMTRLTWCVLSSVGLEGITTPSGVADNLGVARPVLSRLIKAMVADGLLQTQLAHGDGRNRTLSLTAQGEQKLAACLPHAEANALHFRSKFTADQLAILHGLLETLVDGEQGALDTL